MRSLLNIRFFEHQMYANGLNLIRNQSSRAYCKRIYYFRDVIQSQKCCDIPEFRILSYMLRYVVTPVPVAYSLRWQWVRYIASVGMNRLLGTAHSAHCTLYATRLTQTLALIRSDGVTDKHARIIFCVQFSCVRLFSPSCRLLVAGPHCHAAFLCIITYLRSTFCYTNQTKFYYSQNHKLKIPTMGYVW